MAQDILTPQNLGISLLRTVQALYQSGEITSKQKNKMVEEIRYGIATSDFQRYTESLLSARYSSSFKSFIDEDLLNIKKIQNQNKENKHV